jgi:AraC-like DNA-binding protein
MPLKSILNRERITLLPERTGLPEIKALGRLNYAKAHAPLSHHRHPGCMEICYLSKGRQVYKVGSREYALRGGDVFVTFPDEAHSTGKRPEEKSILYWVIVDLAGRNRPFLGLAPEQARELKKGLLSLKTRRFHGGVNLRDALDKVILAANDPEKPLRDLFIRNRLVGFLLHVVYYSKGGASRETAHALKGVIAHIDGHPEEKSPVTDLARMAGLSVSRFKAKFKKVMGIPPAEYMLRKKVERAREMLALRKGSVTDIAFSLDFSSSQYFATVFKRYTGKTPVEILKKE